MNRQEYRTQDSGVKKIAGLISTLLPMSFLCTDISHVRSGRREPVPGSALRWFAFLAAVEMGAKTDRESLKRYFRGLELANKADLEECRPLSIDKCIHQASPVFGIMT